MHAPGLLCRHFLLPLRGLHGWCCLSVCPACSLRLASAGWAYSGLAGCCRGNRLTLLQYCTGIHFRVDHTAFQTRPNSVDPGRRTSFQEPRDDAGGLRLESVLGLIPTSPFPHSGGTCTSTTTSCTLRTRRALTKWSPASPPASSPTRPAIQSMRPW